ncbi:MAG TPA: hypothetical protein PLE59_00700 [Bacteroidales bacterium]|nr:hypothetical protein [Bacteroidales bacterium]HPL02015.1 hypothetical protein [Bacteroidales bacterium]HQJ75656.1 hypothetical protein [Bacteroidota bacterium]HRR19545.1 hypothetical protein [Ignavibacteriales bacterium]
MNAPFWEVKMRANQLKQYYEEKNRRFAEMSKHTRTPKPINSFRIPRGYK